MAEKRITDVASVTSLNNDDSFFVNKSNTIKQVKKKDIVFGIANGGTGATDANSALQNLGAAPVEHGHDASEITSGVFPLERIPTIPVSNISGALTEDNLPIIPVSGGGTGSSDGATGLKNLFAAGYTVLSSNQYGTNLPSAGMRGRIFFKKVSG